ncbi:hypothetical protein HMI49_11825 [Corallococcus exercitus]|uniref:Uncharacterized protein n=1 Tax=Corallococcus exercitus TaxID=2316736 RepID=A0A7Y4KHG6_9BACT|nr:hypothetical protein [Corallococcus exercitus]NOK33888.1 hypothetical protein [Corallococcus exercitus]
MADDNRGQWQAQGNDISANGHCHPWNEPKAPTKADALLHLVTVTGRCTQEQRTLRDGATRKAQAYIKRAPPDGIPGFHMKSFKVKSPPQKARKARIDLEITSGRALCDATADDKAPDK